MIALVIEGAVGDNYVSRMRLMTLTLALPLGLFVSLLLGTNHYQRQLTR